MSEHTSGTPPVMSARALGTSGGRLIPPLEVIRHSPCPAHVTHIHKAIHLHIMLLCFKIIGFSYMSNSLIDISRYKISFSPKYVVVLLILASNMTKAIYSQALCALLFSFEQTTR